MASEEGGQDGRQAEGIAEYVARLGGKRAVKRILIANNGIAAVKAIRSIRRWAYETFGNEREVRCGRGRRGEGEGGGRCTPFGRRRFPVRAGGRARRRIISRAAARG
jgi:hypothetical protein